MQINKSTRIEFVDLKCILKYVVQNFLDLTILT